jgi:hypothetical protein
MHDVNMVARVAAATALKAQEQGLSRAERTREGYMERASRRILQARHLSRILSRDMLESNPKE